MHFRARSYDPRVGRFVQREPELSSRWTLHYSYADSSPLRIADPTGEVIIVKGTDDARIKFREFLASSSGNPGLYAYRRYRGDRNWDELQVVENQTPAGGKETQHFGDLVIRIIQSNKTVHLEVLEQNIIQFDAAKVFPYQIDISDYLTWESKIVGRPRTALLRKELFTAQQVMIHSLSEVWDMSPMDPKQLGTKRFEETFDRAHGDAIKAENSYRKILGQEYERVDYVSFIGEFVNEPNLREDVKGGQEIYRSGPKLFRIVMNSSGVGLRDVEFSELDTSQGKGSYRWRSAETIKP
jgi:hypothetical protein